MIAKAWGTHDVMEFSDAIEAVGKAIDAAGVLVIALGVVLAAALAVRHVRQPGTYRRFRQNVGRSILLGLELLIAGDIIRTVAVAPTFQSVGVLAVIVGIRTFLSMTLELELTGRWPWQQRPPGSLDTE